MPLYTVGIGKLLTILLCLCMLLAGCSGERRQLRLGDPAPGFSGRDLEGRKVTLAALRGGPVILRFWSTDCKYCRADTPVFNRYYDLYRDQGLAVIYINTEAGTAELREFVEELQIEFPVISDPNGNIATSYRVKILPQTIILDAEHRIIAAMLGGVSHEQLEDLLLPYFDPSGRVNE